MRNSIKLNIPSPCNMDWNTFDKTAKGGFCHSCTKEVVDFSKLADSEIAEFFKAKHTSSVCGKFKPEQLNKEISFRQTFTFNRITFSAVALGVSAMMVSSPMKAQTKQSETQYNPPQHCTHKSIIVGKVDIPKSSIEITGRVVDEMGQPLLTVEVVLKGTEITTLTDTDGRFSLSVDKEELEKHRQLQFLYLGYESKEISLVGDINQIKEVMMSLDPNVLGKIVCVQRRGFFSRAWWKLRRLF